MTSNLGPSVSQQANTQALMEPPGTSLALPLDLGNTAEITGTLQDASFPSTLPAVDGSALTNLTAANMAGVALLASANTFTATPQSVSHASAPEFRYNETGAGANAKLWRTIASGGQWALQTINDAVNSVADVIRVARSGTTPTAVTITATSVAVSNSGGTLGFYGIAPASQRAAAIQAASVVSVSSNITIAASLTAWILEVTNTLTGLGLWKGSA